MTLAHASIQPQHSRVSIVRGGVRSVALIGQPAVQYEGPLMLGETADGQSATGLTTSTRLP
jgi:hypothetical protein